MPSMVNPVLAEGFDDFRNFVNPLITQRAELSGEPLRITGTRDGQLVDTKGNTIECFHGTQAFGHRNPIITNALREFLNSDSPNWFPSRVNPYSGKLARQLCERASASPMGSRAYNYAYFANSGSEAVESGMKLSRAVTKRPRILGLEKAYHGCTMGSCALMGDGIYRNLFAPHLPDVERLPFDDIDVLYKNLQKGDVAAVIVEPIQLEGGVRPLSKKYIEALCELTERSGTLLMADEVQTGLGRTGQFLASESWPRRPDAVFLAKHLGGGLMPISAMLSRMDLFKRAYGANFELSEAHNCTFSGSAAAAVAALATLEVLTDDLIRRVAVVGQEFINGLTEALSDLPLFEEVRGKGFAIGIVLKDFDHPWLSFEHFGMSDLSRHPSTGLLLCHRLYKRGFFCFVCGHDWRVLRIQPRYNIEQDKLSSFIQIVREELKYLCTLV